MDRLFAVILCLILLCACAGETSLPDSESESVPELESEMAAAVGSGPEAAQVQVSLPVDMGNVPQYNISQLQPGVQYVASARLFLDFPAPDETHKLVQGGCMVGDYFYIANYINDDLESRVVISVVNMDGDIVSQSDPLDLDHANCITYVEKQDALLVSHCQSEDDDAAYYRYSLVDRSSLTLMETGQLKYPFFAMSYCSEKDMFVSAQWAGETLDIWDGKLNHLKSLPVEVRGSLSQGAYATEEGIWFVRSSKKIGSASLYCTAGMVT